MTYAVSAKHPGALYGHVGGAWKKATNVWIKNEGAWMKVNRLHMNVGKTGQELWDNSVSWNLPVISVDITSDTPDLDLYSIVSDHPDLDAAQPVAFDITNPSAYTIYSTNNEHGAIFESTPLAVGSRVNLTNSGDIYGCNGAGGRGGQSTGSPNVHTKGFPGEDGGSAISVSVDISIDNRIGAKIYAGGGGGGGGGGHIYWLRGGSGGGGQPGGLLGTSNYGPSEDGDSAPHGVAVGGRGPYVTGEPDGDEAGGAGGQCEGYAQVGQEGQASGDYDFEDGLPGGAGGQPGIAVVSDGTITWSTQGDVRP